MLKSITFAIASIGIVAIADCTRADIGNNSHPSHPEVLLYAQATTKLKKPLVYKSKLGSQVFSTQKSNFKPSTGKPYFSKSKNIMSIPEQSTNTQFCDRLARNHNYTQISHGATIDNGKFIPNCTISPPTQTQLDTSPNAIPIIK